MADADSKCDDKKNAQNATKNYLKLLGKMCQNGLVMTFIVPETALLF